ncbi:hypothetical protein SLE2022_291280 [Rubroshorea leprosula]
MAGGAIVNIPVIEMVQPETVDSRRIGFHNGVPILSRYLRDPKGSCHDICKYGMRYTGEETNSSSPTSRKIIAARAEGQNMDRAEIITIEKKKKNDVSFKPSSHSKTQVPDNLVVINTATGQGQGQNLEMNVHNRMDRKKKCSPKHPPDPRMRRAIDPFVIKSALKQDEGQNLETAELNLLDRKKKSRTSRKPSPDSVTFVVDDPAIINATSLQSGGQHLEKADNTSSERKKKSGSSLKPPPDSETQQSDDPAIFGITQTRGEGQFLEKKENNSLDSGKKSGFSPKLSPDCRTVEHDNPPFGRSAVLQDESQNLEVVESSSGERNKISEISLMPSLVIKPYETNDCPVVEITPMQAGCQNLERAQENLAESGKKSENFLKSSPDSENQKLVDLVVTNTISTEGSNQILEKAETSFTGRNKREIRHKNDSKIQAKDGPVSIELTTTEGEDQHLEKTRTHVAKGNKKPEYRVKCSPQSESYKPVGPADIKRESSLLTNKATALSKQVRSTLYETDVSIAHAADSKVKLQWGQSAILTQTCSSGKGNTERGKSKEMGARSMNSPGVPSYRSKGEIRTSKGIKAYWEVKKKGAAPSSICLSARESGNGVSSTNATNSKNLKGISHLKNHVSVKNAECKRYRAEDAKSLKKVRGVSHLKNQQNLRSTGIEQPSSEGLSEKNFYITQSKSLNKSVGSIQIGIRASNLSSLSPSFSGEKSMKHAPNRISTGHSPVSYVKKNMTRRQNGVQACEVPPPLSLSAVRKGLRRTQNRIDIIQPSQKLSLTSSRAASSRSSHGDASPEHDEPDAKKQTRSSKVLNRSRHKKAGIHIPKDKQLIIKKMNFKKGRVIELQPQDFTPRKLKFRQRMPVDSKNVDNQNVKDDVRSINSVDFTAQRLKFKQRMHVDNKNSYSQNVKGDGTDAYSIGKNVEGMVDEKKESGGLLNNVIEETASKLVEARRSKVRALVGAFESVFSLLDTKTVTITSPR